jgi:hypothetical protein
MPGSGQRTLNVHEVGHRAGDCSQSAERRPRMDWARENSADENSGVSGAGDRYVRPH